MSDNRFMMLQFFADGAAGGDGGEGAASTGDNAADAGRDLEALGVPRDKAERYRQRMEKRGKSKAVSTDAPPSQPPAADPGKESDAWDTFFSDPKNKDRLEQMMAERGKRATEAKNAATEQMAKLSPTLKLLGEKYGVQPNEDGSYDIDAINKAVNDDDSYFEEKAVEMGVSVEVAKKLAHADEIDRQQQEAAAQAQRRAQLQEHFNNVQQQARALQQIFPDFNLDQAMQDPEFVRRTAPGGMPVKDAWYSLHGDEILKEQAANITQRAKQAASANVAAGGNRPRENGSASMATVSTTPNPKSMGREAYKQYIMQKYDRKNVYR